MKEELWKILLKNIEWIKFSEAKAIFLLTIYGVIITIVYSNSGTVYTSIVSSKFAIFCTTLAAIFAIVSAFYCFKSLDPVLKNKNPSSVIYYGHIQKAFPSFTDYYTELKLVVSDDEQYNQQLSEQVFVTSQIAWRKFRYVSISIRAFFITMFFVFVDLTVYLFII